MELVSDEAWAKVYRVPEGWLKVCAPVQAFEPRLSAALSERWPGRVAHVLEYEDGDRFLMADAGTPIGSHRPYVNPPDAWERVLPHYAELQRGEMEHVHEHLAGGVPDLRTEALPDRYEQMLARELPLEPDEIERLRRFAPRYAELCAELASRGIEDSIQHDDLHMANVFDDGGSLRVLDWGDSCVSHPFMSLVETFRHLRETEFHPRLRDAYLEPWGGAELLETFEIALRVGTIAHSFAWLRQYDNLPPEALPGFGIEEMLRLAVAQTG